MRNEFCVVKDRLRQILRKVCQRGGRYVHIKQGVEPPDRVPGPDRNLCEHTQSMNVAAHDGVFYEEHGAISWLILGLRTQVSACIVTTESGAAPADRMRGACGGGRAIARDREGDNSRQTEISQTKIDRIEPPS
jgi:hypothetical protein